MTLVRAWRITKTRYAAQAFDGKGARLAGGRWNSPGVALVYTSSSASLVALEMLVHLENASILSAYSLIWCEFDAAISRPLERALLPKQWRSSPPPPETQALGDRWIAAGTSAVLEVPSAVIPEESNYLINPAHPEFRRIRVGPARPMEIDPRLLGARD